MINFHLEEFLGHYRLNIGKLDENKLKGLTFLHSKLIHSARIDTAPKAACVLGNVKWETADTFQPVTEYGSFTYLKSKLYYPFIGRGYIQLTWKENYEKFGKALNIPLVGMPYLANDPEIAWKILEMGMTDVYDPQTLDWSEDPDFTSKTLEDYFTNEKSDFYNSRKIINPADKKSFQPIADLSERILECILASIINERDT